MPSGWLKKGLIPNHVIAHCFICQRFWQCVTLLIFHTGFKLVLIKSKDNYSYLNYVCFVYLLWVTALFPTSVVYGTWLQVHMKISNTLQWSMWIKWNKRNFNPKNRADWIMWDIIFFFFNKQDQKQEDTFLVFWNKIDFYSVTHYTHTGIINNIYVWLISNIWFT